MANLTGYAATTIGLRNYWKNRKRIFKNLLENAKPYNGVKLT